MTNLLLILLLVVGCSPTEQADVYGCTDIEACNFNEEANSDDGNCYYAEDWEDECEVCDLVPSNDCVQDECGEWGGSGITDECGNCLGEDIEWVELWGECYNIEETTNLYLSYSGLTGEIPPEIGNLINLEYLNLHDNQLTGEIPPEIGNLINLEYLRLFNNSQLTGDIPSEIGNLTNLTELSLSYNQLTGDIPSEIGNLTNLTELSLSYNQLTGDIPSEIGNLTNLTELSLHSNQLSGEIQPEIGDLINLTHLYLSINQFTGDIPSEIGNLTNLTVLHLHSNQLTSLLENICYLSTDYRIYDNQICEEYHYDCISDFEWDKNGTSPQDQSNCCALDGVEDLNDFMLMEYEVFISMGLSEEEAIQLISQIYGLDFENWTQCD